MRRDLPLMRRVAVLKEVNALPSAQHHAPVHDRNAKTDRQHGGFNMCGHVVWPLQNMGQIGHLRIIGRRHKSSEIRQQIALHVRIGVFLYQ